MQVTEAKTVFAEVLAELMQAKGIDPTPQAMRQLAERSELDVVAFEARLASAGTGHPGKLGPLANELELDKNERDRIAYAFAYERRLPEPELEELREDVMRALDKLTTARRMLEESEELGWFVDNPKLREIADSAVEQRERDYQEALKRYQAASPQA